MRAMFMSKRAQWTVLASLVMALLLAGCCPIANNAPQITSLGADPATVDPEANTTITCVAADADGDTLTYAWRATAAPLLEAYRGQEARWTGRCLKRRGRIR